MADGPISSDSDDHSRVSVTLLDEYTDHYDAVFGDRFCALQMATLAGPLATCAAAIREHGFVYRATLLGLVGVVGEEVNRTRAELDGEVSRTTTRCAVRNGDATVRESCLHTLEVLSSILTTAAKTPTVPRINVDERAHTPPGHVSRQLGRERRQLSDLIDEESPLEIRDLPEKIDALCEQLDAVGPVDYTLVRAVHDRAARGIERVAGEDPDCVEALGRVLRHVAPLHHPGFPAY